jgi:hypothetical protein
MKQALEALEGYEGRRAKDILRQAIEQAEKVEPLTNSYVQHVPDKCDRIIWRNQYIHLPPTAPSSDWNRRIRDSVDSLLAQAGMAEDCSVRHQLACMNFDAPAQPTVPQGWKLVPIEPTEEMALAAEKATWIGTPNAKFAYRAMLSAAPTAPAHQPLTDEQIRDLVKECGLDWHRGFYPLFDGDETNRFAVLVQATEAAHGIKGASL